LYKSTYAHRVPGSTSEFAIKRTSTSDQVADYIRDRVIRGELEPGTPLREIALSQSLGVSRNTVREGIKVLVAEGLLRHNVHRGAIVARLSGDDVRDIYRIRRTLEVTAVKQATKGDERLGELRIAADEIDRAARSTDLQRIVDADLRFHTLLVDLLNSQRLSSFFRFVTTELRLALFLLDRTDAKATQWSGDHRVLCDLLATGRRGDAAKLLTHHLDAAEERLVDVIGRG
jgi:DNA-binding GntR family transcriptional regulator